MNSPAKSNTQSSGDVDQLLRIPTRDTLDDKLNQQIISMLEIDGRLPFKEIAIALDVSEGTVRNRVNRLKEAGILQFRALVDRSALNYATDSMLGIKVSPTSSPEAVANRLNSCDEIVFMIWLTGRYDLLVEIVSDGDDTLCRFLETHIFNREDISNVEVMKGLATYKNQFLLKSHKPIGKV